MTPSKRRTPTGRKREIMRETGLFLPCGKEFVDKQRKIVAISAFEYGGGRQPGGAEPLAEGREVGGLEGHLGDGVAHGSIETGGDKNEVGLKCANGIK